MARLDVVFFDELGYPPFTQPGSRPLFYLIARIYELIMVLLLVKLARGEWPSMFGDAKATADSLLGQLPRHRNRYRELAVKKSSERIASKKQLGDALNNEWSMCIFPGHSSAPSGGPIFNPIGCQNSRPTGIRH